MNPPRAGRGFILKFSQESSDVGRREVKKTECIPGSTSPTQNNFCSQAPADHNISNDFGIFQGRGRAKVLLEQKKSAFEAFARGSRITSTPKPKDTSVGTTSSCSSNLFIKPEPVNGIPKSICVSEERKSERDSHEKPSMSNEFRNNVKKSNLDQNTLEKSFADIELQHELEKPSTSKEFQHKLEKSNSNEMIVPDTKCKTGISGHSVDVLCNFIHINVKEGCGAYEYNVKFDPPIEYTAFRRKMFREHITCFEGAHTFDGASLLYLSRKLPNNVTKFVSSHPMEKYDVTIQIIFVKVKKMNEMIHLYNILFHKIMKELKFQRLGKNYFDPKLTTSIPQYRLQIWPGYVASVTACKDGLMLNLDPLHRTLRYDTVLEEINLINKLSKCETSRRNNIKKALIGKIVMTGYNCKTYMVSDVDFDTTPLSTFKRHTNEEITYLEYYKVNYGLEITKLDQPMLISRGAIRVKTDEVVDNLVALVPELCNSTGLTDEMRNDVKVMKSVAMHTRITPNQRYLAMKKYIENVHKSPKACELLNGWGLSLADSPVKLTARIIPQEEIHFGRNIKCPVSMDGWGHNSTISPVLQPVDISNWIILYTRKDENATQEFVGCVLRCATPMGIDVKHPKMILLQSDSTENYLKNLKSIIKPDVQIVVCVCPANREDRYAAIKKLCCVSMPIASQVINGYTLGNRTKLRSISQKILLQMNCKLGGSLWSLAVPLKKLMTIGLDVFHSPNDGVASVCAFVASTNPALTQWYSRVCFQKQNQEIIDIITFYLKDALKVYLTSNGFLPDRIIFYRDGVGDGQLKFCSDYEVPQIFKTFQSFESTYKPSLSYIVVQKRNNTRFLSPPDRSNSTWQNPKPGMVVDNSICRKIMYDFYLVSQKTLHGSVIPTHYIVVFDSTNLDADRMQRLTYKMCHLYFNFTGLIRVPAPCQYAHKLAYFVGCSLRCQPNDKLSNKLFFL